MRNFRNKIKYISTSTSLSAAILLALPIAAHAVTFNLSPEGTPQTNEGLYPPSSQPYNGIVDFNSGSAPTTPPISYSGGTVKNITQTNNYAPANDTSNFLIAGRYYDTNGGPYPVGPVNISFATPVKYFGMYWGLVNASNTVTFRNASNQTIGTFTGQNLFNTGQVTSQGSKYVNFFAGTNESISQIILSDTSTNNGFETDNHAFSYQVPFGFSPGLGIVGLGAWGAIVQFKRRWQEEKSIKKPALAE